MGHFARSHVEQIGPSLLPFAVAQVRLEGYLQCLAAVALVYDAIITMDREIKFFWKVPRSPVDFIYFANRYIGIFGAIIAIFGFTLSENLGQCNFALWAHNSADWLTVVLTDYILTIRVLALYFKDRTLATCLYLILAVEAMAKLAIIAYVNIFEHVTVGGAGGITICVAKRIPHRWLVIFDWSLQLAYGVILMVFAFYKAAEYWRMSAGFKGFTLVKVLIEDQALYFMSVILVSLFAMLEIRLQITNAIAASILIVLGNQSFLCILGSRMLLNLKEAGERGQNEGTSFIAPSRTVSNIEFGEPPANVEVTRMDDATDGDSGREKAFAGHRF